VRVTQSAGGYRHPVGPAVCCVWQHYKIVSALLSIEIVMKQAMHRLIVMPDTVMM